MLGHKVSDDAGEGLPLLLSFFLVILKEVIVGLEHGKSDSFDLHSETLSAQKCGVCLDFDHTVLLLDQFRVVHDDLRLNRFEREETSLLELQELLTVRGTALSIENEWRVKPLLDLLLPLKYLLEHVTLLFLVVAFNEKTTIHRRAVTHKRNPLGCFLGYVTRRLEVHVEHYVKPALVIAYYRSRWLLTRLPVWSEVLSVVDIDVLGAYIPRQKSNRKEDAAGRPHLEHSDDLVGESGVQILVTFLEQGQEPGNGHHDSYRSVCD